MATRPEVDPIESPLDPDATQLQPPLTGTVDDDNSDDEHWDENEAPARASSDEDHTLRDEFRLDEREEEKDAAADD